MIAFEAPLAAGRTVPPRPLAVILGGDDADRLAAVAALPLVDAILIGHREPVASDLAARARRIDDIAADLLDPPEGPRQAELESSPVGRALISALQERRAHLLLLDLNRASDLGPPKASGDASTAATIAAVETLMRLLDEHNLPLRIDSLNRECPVSLAVGCGMLSPAALNGTGVSVVVVPLIPRDCDAAVENFALWNDRQCFPRDSRGAPTTDLAFIFNCPADPELERRLRDAFAASPAARRCFRAMRVAFLGLEGEDDRYIRRASGPMPRYGYKAGPNLLFFGALAQLRAWGYKGFAALTEVDCRPLRRGWLDALDRLARRHPDAWVIGSIYRGHGVLGDGIKRHLNGNALYAISSPGFHDFLHKGYLAWLQVQITQREADLAFDTAWDRFLCCADPERANSGEWRVAQHVLPRFISCDEIVNIAGDPEIRGQIAFSRETLRRAFPAACLVHGPIAVEDRNTDLTTLPEALSRLAIDNAIGHAAEGLKIEEWFAAPGLSRRGAATWQFASAGPETVAGLLLSTPSGLLEAKCRLVAHVAVRSDRRTMLRFSLVPDGETWRASSRDIFLQPAATKRFRIELGLTEAARIVGFRVCPASVDETEALTIDFDELRFERLDPDGRHEGGLSLGLTSLEAANYGALSVIGSTPVPPEGGSAPTAIAPAVNPKAPPVWVPRLALSDADEIGLRRLSIAAPEGSRELAALRIAEGRIAGLALNPPEGQAPREMPEPRSGLDLVSFADSEAADPQRTIVETLAVHWDQITALVAANGQRQHHEVSPVAAASAKAEPAGLLEAIDPLWHQPGGRAEIAGILAAVVDEDSASDLPFSGLFRSLGRIAADQDRAAAWRVAQSAIEGRGGALPRGAAVAVAGLLDDRGRLQAFANHLAASGAHEAAAEVCRISVALGEAPRDAYLVLARSEAAQGASDAAGVTLQLGAPRYPADPALNMDLVKWHGARGEADLAGEAAWRLAQTPQEHPDVIAELASRLVLAGRHDDAIAFGEDYLTRNPDLRLALSMLDAAAQARRHADALRLARKAVELGASPRQIAGPVISAAARLWEVDGTASFAEDLLTRGGEARLLATLLDARLGVFEAQRDGGAIDAAGAAELLDWIHARRESFDNRLKTRALELAAWCGLRPALERGLREWRASPTPQEAARIGRALLADADPGRVLPEAAAELAWLLVSEAARGVEGRCELLIAVEIAPESPALRLAAQLAGFEIGDPALVRHHGRLQPEQAFDRPLPLWPLRGDAAEWPHDPMAAFAEREALQAAARLEQAPDAVEWPRIAVVMPSLNAEGTIDESLLSILNQGYPNLNVTLVDGGSTDGTLDVLSRHADRVRVIVEPGLCQSGAVSLGFRESEGDLFCWLNADDLLLPGALFAVAGTWLASRADVIVGDCLHFRDSSIIDLVTADRMHPPLDLAQLLDVERKWLDGRYLTQPEVFFTRAAYEKAGGVMDGRLSYAMDYELWLRMAAAGVQSVTLPRPLAAFRRHAQQKTARQFDAFAELVAVRNSHPAAPRRAARAPNMGHGTLALCPWDAPEGSPLHRLLADGKAVPLPGHRDADGVVLLPPSLAREHSGPILDILGLGGPLPHAAAVAEQLRLREGSSAAWVWTPEVEFTAKLRLSRLFGSVVPTDAVSGAYLHHLDPRLAELPECSTLDPLRRAPVMRRAAAGESARWLHLSAGDAFSYFLPHGARILRPASLYSLAQGDSDTARGFLASFDIVSMSAPGNRIPGLAHDAAALGCRTLVVTSGPSSGLVDDLGILLVPPPTTEAQAAATITAAEHVLPAPTGPAAHDLVSRTAIFKAAFG